MKKNQLVVEHQTYTEYKTEREVSTVLTYITKANDKSNVKTTPVSQTVKVSVTKPNSLIAKQVKKLLLNKPVKAEQAKSITALSMLEYWWQQASKTEKEAFKEKINVK